MAGLATIRSSGRRSPAVLLALAAGLSAAGAMGAVSLPAPLHAAADAGATATVSMKEFKFMPATIQVRAGGSVTWTYDESITDPMPNCETFLGICPGHSTTAVDNGPNGKPLWDSGVHRASGFPYTHTFATPGTYKYYCTVHGGAHPNNPVTHMDGSVEVLPAAAASPAAGATPSTGRAVAVLTPNTGGGTGVPAPAAAALVAAGVLIAAGALRRRSA
jgi:plastocyanin